MATRSRRAVVPAFAALLVTAPLVSVLPTASTAPAAGRVRFADVTAASGITFVNATGDPLTARTTSSR